MIENIYQYTLAGEDLFESLIEQGDFRLNHVVIPPKKSFPKHPTDARVYIIIVEGELDITLGNQENVRYKKGQVIEIPMGTEAELSNGSEEKVEVFVIKR